MAQSNLWHTYINSNHVFVKDGHITSPIDWRFARTGPLFLQFDDPIFTKYNRPMRLENFEECSPIGHNGHIIRRISFEFFKKNLCDLEIADQSPLLKKKMKNVPAAGVRKKILDDLETWNGDIVELRQHLIEFEKNWKKLEFNIPCPIHSTKEEVPNHIQEFKVWQDVYGFWEEMKEVMDEDGYISSEDYQKCLRSWVQYDRGVCKESPFTKGCVYSSKEIKEAYQRRTKWIEKIGWEVLRKRVILYGRGTMDVSAVCKAIYIY
ncbi:hypothetical protein EAE96_007466 [Botrytis aclada]|nr:hypothetical protein EAE96_007466 [Botrytis aclada]